MRTTVTPLTTIYTQWLDSFRAIMPGGKSAVPTAVPAPQQERVIAKQEWENEGGSVKPGPKAGKAKSKPGTKSKQESKQARKKRR